MEYLKILDSAQRSFGQKESYTIVFIAGGIGYMHQEDDNIVCTMEDLIFIKPGNKVKLEYRKNKYPLEVYVLYIGGELLRKLSDEETRLDEAFDFVPYQVKIVHSETESAMLIKNISKKLYSMNNELPKFAYQKKLSIPNQKNSRLEMDDRRFQPHHIPNGHNHNYTLGQ